MQQRMNDAKRRKAYAARTLHMVVAVMRKRDERPKQRYVDGHKPPAALFVAQTAQHIQQAPLRLRHRIQFMGEQYRQHKLSKNFRRLHQESFNLNCLI